jgi:hypothetical protein
MAIVSRNVTNQVATDIINFQAQPKNEELASRIEVSINKGIEAIDLKSVEKVILMHEDVSAALSSLPDFGFMTKKNLADIQEAQNMLNDLRMMLGNYLYTENKYKETFGSLFKLLDQSGVSECVEDLISVRRNSRKTDDI